MFPVATANRHNGIDSGTAVAPDGRIGSTRFFDNPDAYATVGKFISLGSPADLNFGGRITFEAWVRWNRRDNHRVIICHGGAPGLDLETVLRIGETLDYRTGVWTGVARYAALMAPPADSNTWIQLTGVYTGTEWDLYRNGLKVSGMVDTSGAKMTPGGWRIGAELVSCTVSNKVSNDVPRYYSGWLDEIRLSNVARGADWIKLNYANQKSDQTLIAFGAATTTAVASPPVPWPDPGEAMDRPLEKFDILGRTRWFPGRGM